MFSFCIIPCHREPENHKVRDSKTVMKVVVWNLSPMGGKTEQRQFLTSKSRSTYVHYFPGQLGV